MGNSINRVQFGRQPGEGDLFICGVSALMDVNRLHSLGVRAILNVAQAGLYDCMAGKTSHLTLHQALTPFTVKIVGAEDMPDQDLSQFFVEMTNFIEEQRRMGGGVVVHCAAGVSRACTTCIAYLMLKQHLSCEAGFRMCHRVRPFVSPNSGFWLQLRNLEAQLRVMGTELRDSDGSETPAQPTPALDRNANAAPCVEKVLRELDEDSNMEEEGPTIFVTATVQLRTMSAEAAEAVVRNSCLPMGVTVANAGPINSDSVGFRLGVLQKYVQEWAPMVEKAIRRSLGEEVVSVASELIKAGA